ncbi:zinc finger protein 2-like isoform X2 [Pseudomyrmex gracilis]|uniref:zinc finger protein 2-like isoform X2 n=1 Tax=Pseudomyrmex gracilis TaxID=219809 RepID=UPI000995A008|nr:zinc finger protein 2-like isoform X2 [Pseudomyrmex gracilis]
MTSDYFGLPINMDRVCRICLTESANLSPIFSQEVNDLADLSHKIQVCGSIEINEQDGLPTLICSSCVYKANVAHDFRQQCQHSDARLRMYYNKPAKYNITEQQHSRHDYFVNKEDLSIVNTCANPQEYIEPTDTFSRDNVSLNTNQIPNLPDKLFMCSIGFEGNKEEEGKDSCMPEGNVQMEIMQEDVQDTSNIIYKATSLQTKSDEAMEVSQCMEKSTTEEQFVNLPSDNAIEEENVPQEDVPQKRTSTRKAKLSKTYSDEDNIDDDYFEPSSDSRDSVDSKFKCKVCLKQYATLKGLKKHALVHEKKYKCNVCCKMFYKQENMEKHQKIHASKPHACQLCHASFSKPQTLVRHLKSHTDKVNDMIKQINTNERRDSKEPKKEPKLEDDSEDDVRPANETEEFEAAPEMFKCDTCNQYCSSSKNLKRHALLHGEKRYSCTVCNKWFYRPDTLKKHAEKHGHGLLDNLADNNKMYDDSDDEMPSNNTAEPAPENENIKKEESDEDGTGEYKCQHCDKVMATKKGLRRHVSLHKPKAEPVTCEICRKVCASQARLVLHQRTHKPKEKVPREYLCHICSKVYPSNSSLTYHMRTHTGVKPHVCTTCNSGFTTTTSLANHIRIHTGDKPFVCHVCSAAFAVSSAFRRHLTRHTGEANYVCPTCNKAFKRLSTLKEHTYTHSGEKPYVCKTCSAAYSHSGSLFAHQKRCRAQYGEMIVEDQNHHHIQHPVSHIHMNMNPVNNPARPLTVLSPTY